MGTVAFRSLTAAEQIFKSLIWDPMIQAGEVWIEGAVPFLALPLIKQIDEATIQAITDAIFSQVVMTVDVTAIKLVNNAHQAAYDSFSEDLALVADEQGVDSDAFKQAQTKALAGLSQFTRVGAQ